ncbi:MAG: hypothetical protein RRB13_00395 [bacterium]|nr:hypothetical protein [bacterium]
MKPSNSRLRNQSRHDHAYISLKVEVDGEWHWIKALHWNEIGFNFFFDTALPIGQELPFKKGLTHFKGRIVWQRQEVDGARLIDMALNLILLEHVIDQEHQKDLVLMYEVMDMVRDGEHPEYKLQFAAEHLNLIISEDDLRGKINQNQWSELGQVGVEVDSDGWADVVEEALKQSEGILALDEKARQRNIEKLLALKK